MSTTKKGKAGLQPGSGTTGAARAVFRCTATFFPADTIPEAKEKQDKIEKALIGLLVWLIFIIASNSNPYYNHTIPRLPPKELFSASELLNTAIQTHSHMETLLLLL